MHSIFLQISWKSWPIVFSYCFSDIDVLVTKRKTNGAAEFKYMKLSEFYENYDGEEWILDGVLTKEQQKLIQVNFAS